MSPRPASCAPPGCAQMPWPMLQGEKRVPQICGFAVSAALRVWTRRCTKPRAGGHQGGSPRFPKTTSFNSNNSGGEGGIRTPETGHPVCRISSAVRSTTLPPLQASSLARLRGQVTPSIGRGASNPGRRAFQTTRRVGRVALSGKARRRYRLSAVLASILVHRLGAMDVRPFAARSNSRESPENGDPTGLT